MTKSNKSERIVVKNALRVLDLNDLKIDRSYQRGVTLGAQKIADNYNPVSFGIPLVGERDDGSFWVVDGQQRIEALKIRNGAGKMNNPHKNVRCEVFASRGPEHEAEIFKEVNKDRTRLEPLQLFHAMLTAGEEHCWKLKKLAEKYGFAIPRGKGHGTKDDPETRSKQLYCVDALGRTLTRNGEDCLEFVLETISKIWPNDPLRTKNTIVSGLRLFWKNHDGVVDMERLIPRLMSTTPAKILYQAGLGISSGDSNVADLIERLYNKRSTKKS